MVMRRKGLHTILGRGRFKIEHFLLPQINVILKMKSANSIFCSPCSYCTYSTTLLNRHFLSSEKKNVNVQGLIKAYRNENKCDVSVWGDRGREGERDSES